MMKPVFTRQSRIDVVTCAMILLGLLSPAQAELAPHLDLIGWDEVDADPRFEGLLDDGGLGQGIAVFDTGLDATHVLFSDRNTTGENFADNPTSPDWGDVDGHGTFVSSIAAGNEAFLEEGLEIGGIARGADLVSVRVLDNVGQGSFTDIVNGLDFVIDQVDNHGSNIQVVNLSLGTSDTFVTEPTGLLVNQFNNRVEALADRGVAVVAASGNSGSRDGLSFPAISDMVFAVGSSTLDDAVSDFTNRNNELDLLAPGEEVFGAFQDPDVDTLIAQGSGTSFAAPQVSGALLLINEVFEDQWGREATVEELLHITSTSAVMITDENGRTFPRLDLYSSLDRAYTIPEPATAGILAGVGMFLLRRGRAN